MMCESRMAVIDVKQNIAIKDFYLFAQPPSTDLHRKFTTLFHEINKTLASCDIGDGPGLPHAVKKCGNVLAVVVRYSKQGETWRTDASKGNISTIDDDQLRTYQPIKRDDFPPRGFAPPPLFPIRSAKSPPRRIQRTVSRSHSSTPCDDSNLYDEDLVRTPPRTQSSPQHVRAPALDQLDGLNELVNAIASPSPPPSPKK
jgi:hypothetical protein